MTNAKEKQLPATVSEGDANTLANILITGDLSKLDQKQQWGYYVSLCERLQIDPYTRPFQLLNLKGKLTMYATKACTEQLATTRNLTVDPYDVQLVDGLAIVKAKALKPTGQYATASGVVSVENLKGEDKANAVMKAETKACRRAVLRLCGLGMLDETETTGPWAQGGQHIDPVQYSVSDATEYGPPDENGEVKPVAPKQQSKSQAGGKTAQAGGQTGKPQSDARKSQETAPSASQGAETAPTAGSTSTPATSLIKLEGAAYEFAAMVNSGIVDGDPVFDLTTHGPKLREAFGAMFGGVDTGRKVLNHYLMNVSEPRIGKDNAHDTTWEICKGAIQWARNPANTQPLISG